MFSSHKYCMHFLFPMHATLHTHHILNDLVILTILCGKYKVEGSLFCSFLPSCVTQSRFICEWETKFHTCKKQQVNSYIYIYIKRLGMFPFKVQLFQGCKSETEPINTKSVVQHVMGYQVFLAAYYKVDTKYCCCRATCLSGHIVDFTTHISAVCVRYQVLLAVYYKVFWT
jgi:hypothetical protein